MNDLRHAWRSIARMPLLAIVVVSSLAVGIGVNTAVFSWVQALFLRPLPGVADAGRLYLVEPRTETGSYPGVSIITKPLLVTGSANLYTSRRAVVPPLAIAPSDFS